MAGSEIISVGELIVEIMRKRVDSSPDRPGTLIAVATNVLMTVRSADMPPSICMSPPSSYPPQGGREYLSFRPRVAWMD